MDERIGADLLGEGKAFADLSHRRKTLVSGGDAFGWLNDLVSADISGLRAGQAKRALLLSPTGRVRAEFTVVVTADGILLIQDPMQPEAVDELLARYVLSSDVDLQDRTQELAVFGFPGLGEPPEVAGTTVSAPSCLGRGVDLLAPSGDHDRLVQSLERTYQRAGDDDVEAWRVRAGIPRFGVDGSPDDLPQECGLEQAVAFGKGCYLGQEAIAKVRNLGHPRRLLVHLEAADAVALGDTVTARGREVGEITSVTRFGERTVALARVDWDAREGPFETSQGSELSVLAETGADQASAK